MNLKELRDAFRDDIDDVGEPHLFSDAWLNRAINQAQAEACRRARLILDSTEAETCTYGVTQGERFITLSPRVIFVRRVKLDSMDRPLPRIHLKQLDAAMPGWESMLPGDVIGYCPDYKQGTLWFVGPFPANDTVRLTVVREPIALAGNDQSPEIEPRYHEALLEWVKYRAHMRADVEATFNVEAANAHLEAFENEFGKASQAIDETWINQQQMYDPHDGTF